MNAPELLEHMQALGVIVTVVDGHLDIDAPIGTVGPELLAEVKACRADIIGMLSGPPASDIRRAWVFRTCNRQLEAMRIVGTLARSPRWPQSGRWLLRRVDAMFIPRPPPRRLKVEHEAPIPEAVDRCTSLFDVPAEHWIEAN